MSTLTIFSAPKPFTNPHIATIQRNAIQSWMELGSEVEVILVGEEVGLAEVAAELGVRHLPDVRRNAEGTPMVSSIFDLARQNSSSPLLAYVNADILLLPDFLHSTKQVAQAARTFLVVGQRWDLDVRERMEFSAGWQDRLLQDVKNRARRHVATGSDYFIFPRSCFADMPDFAIGRAGWDNWMIYAARRKGWACVDASDAVQIVHQDHDYSHLPGNQPHYKLPETFENIRLAGGRLTIFNLVDADKRLVDGKLLTANHTSTKFWREVEIFPLIRLNSYRLGQLFYAIFHPRKAWYHFRQGQR
jgi:hypothetical protein